MFEIWPLSCFCFSICFIPLASILLIPGAFLCISWTHFCIGFYFWAPILKFKFKVLFLQPESQFWRFICSITWGIFGGIQLHSFILLFEFHYRVCYKIGLLSRFSCSRCLFLLLQKTFCVLGWIRFCIWILAVNAGNSDPSLMQLFHVGHSVVWHKKHQLGLEKMIMVSEIHPSIIGAGLSRCCMTAIAHFAWERFVG